jgi:hypothetical protein
MVEYFAQYFRILSFRVQILPLAPGQEMVKILLRKSLQGRQNLQASSNGETNRAFVKSSAFSSALQIGWRMVKGKIKAFKEIKPCKLAAMP